MPNKMLIDASHPEETRVVVLRGNRVEEFDFESVSKKQLRGNIYLAKVTRVEPSLQAAFVDYGGNRHGFLAFSEIHPDYYQIPVVDRQALLEDEARAQRDEEEEEPRAPRRSRRFRHGDRNGRRAERRRGDDETRSGPITDFAVETEEQGAPRQVAEDETRFDSGESGFGRTAAEASGEEDIRGEEEEVRGEEDIRCEEEVRGEEDLADRLGDEASPAEAFSHGSSIAVEMDRGSADRRFEEEPEGENRPAEALETPAAEAAVTDRLGGGPDKESVGERDAADAGPAEAPREARARREESEDLWREDRRVDAGAEAEEEADEVEQIGGDAMEEVPVHRHRYRKQYKIQEVIKRRQVLLVQVVKEERGNKGAALTTYLSLAGRYSVLMPNTARGGGISRKITDATDRQRLKSIVQELDVPEGMGVILRTAGAARTKAEVKRDFEYLLRMWETVRETTLRSTAPTLVYEEGSLIKRAIRDLYNKDIDEVVVAGEDGYREAKEFMRLLMPSHAKNVQPYRDAQPIFAKHGVEAQLDAMFSNQVTLKSGGYLVINQTEALVAIDVNSGRSTREHNIEDTALRTNLEAVEEIARQLRLRDLAGLIVLDLIDMEEPRNNRAVERRLKEALKNDRARIQVGSISHFGLLEMSRQRIRSGVLEGSTVVCPHCAGSGMLRSTASIALHVLRVIEDALMRNASYDITVKTRTMVALYILNQKRAHLRELEKRFGVSITVDADDSLTGTTYYALERGELAAGTPEVAAIPPREAPPARANGGLEAAEPEAEEELVEAAEEAYAPNGPEMPEEGRGADAEADGRPRRRRRRRRGRGGDREVSGIAPNAPQPSDDALGLVARIGGFDTEPAIAPVPAEMEPVELVAELPEAPPSAPVERRRARRGTRPARGPVEAAGTEAKAEPSPRPRRGEEPEPGRPDEDTEAAATRPPRARRSRRGARTPAAAEPVAGEIIGGDAGEPRLAPVEVAPGALSETDSASGAREGAGAGQDEDRMVTVAGAEAQADVAPVPDMSAAPLPPSHGMPTETAAPQDVPEPAGGAPTAPLYEARDEAERPKRSGWWQRARASQRR